MFTNALATLAQQKQNLNRLIISLLVVALVAFTMFLYSLRAQEKFERAPSSSRATKELQQHNDVPVDITILSGGIRTTTEETVYLIKSILMFRTRPITFNIALDRESKKFLQEKVFQHLHHTAHPIRVNFHEIDLEDTKRRAEALNIPIVHHSGYWGMSKLFLDDYFPHTQRTIFIDTDMVLGTDISLLFDEFSKFGEETLVAWTQEDNWEILGPNYVCSCIFLWDMKRTRETKWLHTFGIPSYAKIFGVYSGGDAKDFEGKPLQAGKHWKVAGRGAGDQDYMYAINMVHPKKFNKIDHSWNLTYCRKFWNVQPKSKTPDTTPYFFGAIHFNCLNNDVADWRGWDWMKNYLEWYRWDWFSKPYQYYGVKTAFVEG